MRSGLACEFEKEELSEIILGVVQLQRTVPILRVEWNSRTRSPAVNLPDAEVIAGIKISPHFGAHCRPQLLLEQRTQGRLLVRFVIERYCRLQRGVTLPV